MSHSGTIHRRVFTRKMWNQWLHELNTRDERTPRELVRREGIKDMRAQLEFVSPIQSESALFK